MDQVVGCVRFDSYVFPVVTEVPPMPERNPPKAEFTYPSESKAVSPQKDKQEKLEKYAWEIYKLKNFEDKFNIKFQSQAKYAYEVAEAFLKYTEEKFNE